MQAARSAKEPQQHKLCIETLLGTSLCRCRCWPICRRPRLANSCSRLRILNRLVSCPGGRYWPALVSCPGLCWLFACVSAPGNAKETTLGLGYWKPAFQCKALFNRPVWYWLFWSKNTHSRFPMPSPALAFRLESPHMVKSRMAATLRQEHNHHSKEIFRELLWWEWSNTGLVRIFIGPLVIRTHPLPFLGSDLF